jgi:hypothetical protein
MASNHTFCAQRLGQGDMDSERGCRRGGSGRKEARQDDTFLFEIGRRWCTNSERKHTWRRRRSDVVGFPEIRPTTLPNQFGQPPTLISHIESSSSLPSAPPFQTGQKATRAPLTTSSTSGGIVRTVPVSYEEPKSHHPNRPTRYSQEPAKIRAGRPISQPGTAARRGRTTTLCKCPPPTFPVVKALTSISWTSNCTLG